MYMLFTLAESGHFPNILFTQKSAQGKMLHGMTILFRTIGQTNYSTKFSLHSLTEIKLYFKDCGNLEYPVF